jgi:type VII secretion protein EccB
MQSRRDLVHAYQFSRSHLVSALTTGEPGAGQSPFRRAGLGLLFGTTIALVGCAGFAIFGLIDPATPAASSWRQQGAVVVEQGTGSRFVYLDGELHPVDNYASALLAGGTSSPSIQTVSAASLAGVTDGPAVGIPGAPDSLPAAAGLLPARWALCLDPASPSATVVDLAPGTPATVPANDRLLVTVHGRDYVVWDNVNFPVVSAAALVVLGFGDTTPTPVSQAWLDALPAGPDLAAAPVPGAGEPGPAIGGAVRVVGSLFTTLAAGVEQYYELLKDGLAPISRTEFALRTAVPGVPQPVQLSPVQVAEAPASADRSLLTAVPDILGGAVYEPAEQALCVLQGAPPSGQGTGTAALVTENAATVSQAPLVKGSGAVVPSWGGMLATAPQPAAATVAAEISGSVASPGSGATPAAGTPPEYLITDTGEKYPIANDQAAAALGYGSATPVTLPVQIFNLIPTGPVLSQTAAREAVAWPASLPSDCNRAWNAARRAAP